MSHLDHIVRVKERLTALGVTCPIKQKALVEHAYTDALIKVHFMVNPTFFVPSNESSVMREQLDRWNCISPIDHSNIWSCFLSFINLTLSALTQAGRCDCKNIHVFDDSEKEKVLCVLNTLPEYVDLVNYLGQELRGRHE